ncbi:14198_t:CDS:2 [Funneliformis geosporum]|nr:14198_t:CDS:2 [Funneliformis geosporum]
MNGKEVENFEQVLQKVLEQVPLEDIERVKKFRSFGFLVWYTH